MRITTDSLNELVSNLDHHADMNDLEMTIGDVKDAASGWLNADNAEEKKDAREDLETFIDNLRDDLQTAIDNLTTLKGTL